MTGELLDSTWSVGHNIRYYWIPNRFEAAVFLQPLRHTVLLYTFFQLKLNHVRSMHLEDGKTSVTVEDIPL